MPRGPGRPARGVRVEAPPGVPLPAGTPRVLGVRVVGAPANPGTPLAYARRGYGELFSFPNRPAVPVRPGGDFEFEVETDLDLGEL